MLNQRLVDSCLRFIWEEVAILGEGGVSPGSRPVTLRKPVNPINALGLLQKRGTIYHPAGRGWHTGEQQRWGQGGVGGALLRRPPLIAGDGGRRVPCGGKALGAGRRHGRRAAVLWGNERIKRTNLPRPFQPTDAFQIGLL